MSRKLNETIVINAIAGSRRFVSGATMSGSASRPPTRWGSSVGQLWGRAGAGEEAKELRPGQALAVDRLLDHDVCRFSLPDS